MNKLNSFILTAILFYTDWFCSKSSSLTELGKITEQHRQYYVTNDAQKEKLGQNTIHNRCHWKIDRKRQQC